MRSVKRDKMNEEKKKYRSGLGYASLPPSSGAEKLELSLSVSQKHITSNYQSYSATDTNGKDKRSTHRIDWMTRFSLSPKTAKSIEIAVILIAMFITLCVFSTPIILRETYIVHSHSQNETYIVHSNDCTRYGKKNCSNNFTWSHVLPASNSSGYEIYNGSSCKPFLQTWQECAIGQNEDVFVNVSGDQKILENEVSAVLALIANLNNTECQKAAIPFLCQYVFPLHQCTNGDVYMPSKEQCLYVSTEVCTKEWQLAEYFVPSCTIFPPQTHPPVENSSIPAIDVDNSSFTINVTCRDDFYEINNTCAPRCDKWEQNPHDTTIAVLIVQNFAAWLGLLVGIIVIISSCIRYKNMFTFPSVFLIYMTIDFCIIAIFVIITSFDRPALYCSSKNLTESILNPTTFCTVAGATFHYFLVSIMLWWFFHVCSIFYKVMFPFTAKRTEKYQKYIHLILVIIGILLPLPAVVVTLANPNLSYTINTFPPLLCAPRSADLYYYSAILFLNVLLAIGVSLFIPMFWVVHKHQGIFRPKKRALNIGFAERKILFVLCYYVIFGVLTLCHFGLSTQDQDKFIDAVTEYFTCEYFGNFPGRCERKYFQRYVYPGLTGATYFIMGLIPVANLVFVVDWRRVNQIMKRFSNRCCPRNVHEVEVEEIHSNLSPHPYTADINPSTYENNGVKE